MRIDLHTHSDRSDGTTSPAALVHAAVAAGLDVLALTDHDTSDGWDAAAEAARATGLTLLPGMEISCRWGYAGVHLLAYLPDATYPPLAEELARILHGRTARMPTILRRLNEVGVAIEVDDVHRVSGDATASGRPHVADALVALGVVADRNEAFARFLGPGGPAYVHRYVAPLERMIRLVAEAGGVTVVAHPWARRMHAGLDRHDFADLQSLGLTGIEVDHQDHAPDAREGLRSIAQDLGLVVTGSSDHHGAGKVDHELGCNTTAPEEYFRLLAAADDAARASGRPVPVVVNP